MKCLIVFVVISFASFLLVKGQPKDKDASKICADKLGMKEGEDYSNDQQKIDCFFTCIYMQLGIVDEEGNLDISGFEKFMGQTYTDEQKKAFDTCEVNNKNSDLCKRVLKTQECIYNVTSSE